MIDKWLETLGVIINNHLWFAPILAFIAGVLTSFTPCSLSSVPLVIGYVGGYAGEDVKKAVRYSLVFSLGSAITFTALGAVAALMGQLVQGIGSWWFIFLGVLMVLMALQIWELYIFIPQSTALSKNTKKGYLGAGIAGILAGLFASPCATPVLVVLLALVAEQGSLIWGILLLFLYSIGHSCIIVLAGSSLGFVRKMSSSEQYGKYTQISKIIMGLLVLLLAFYMFYLGF